MKHQTRTMKRQMGWGLAVLFYTGCLAQAAQTPAPHRPLGELVIPKSIFVTDDPSGKDPFFPKREFTPAGLQGKATPKTASVDGLHLKGITTDSEGKRIALINNLTFAAGEESDEVRTESGKLKVKCVEIREKSVVVEVGGKSGQQELALPEKILPASRE